MRNIEITHRQMGRGYTLVIEGVQETILLGADDLFMIGSWINNHSQELQKEINAEADEVARKLLED